MNFDGHDIIKGNRNWIFDLTTFECYHVDVSKQDKVKSYALAFRLISENDSLSAAKYIDNIPIGVYRKCVNIVKTYNKGALLSE